ARGERLAVRGPGYAVDFFGVPLEGQQLLPRGHVPDLDAVVVAGRGQTLAVRAERNLPDPVLVSAQGAHLASGLQIPDLDLAGSLRPIVAVAGRRQQPAVRAEGDAVDGESVALEREGRPKGLRLGRRLRGNGR